MKQPARNSTQFPQFRPLTLALAVSAALASLSVQAGVEIAQQPLLIAEPIAPNIMFILDDSGSMNWEFMPGATGWTSAPPAGLPTTVSVRDIRLRAANINTMWYNPLLKYDPWLKHDGSSWDNANYDGGNLDADPSKKSGSGTLNFKTTFTQWKPMTTGSGDNGIDNSATVSTGTGSTGLSANWRYNGFYHLTGDDATTVTDYKRYEFIYGCATGTGCGDADKQWRARQVSLKTDGTDDSTSELSEFDWTPYGGVKRSVTEEIQNYANWFSYYRLRITMAKGAAFKAFAKLGSGYRVGYNTIWDRQNYEIPVGTNDGLFSGANKQAWFQKLHDSISNDGTPLHRALQRTGEYYKNDTASGPYGPGTGSAQISCRQNFAILTTDGYWNNRNDILAALQENVDDTDGTEHTDSKGNTYKYIAQTPFRDSHSFTLADAAMYYWKTDLRPDMANNVPTTAKNPAFWQHMRTFGISIGEKGTLTPDQATLDALTAGTISWPTPGDDRRENIDDLWHATVNSRGEFVAATSPDEFAKALTDTLNAIASETKYEASGGASSTEVKAGAMTFFSRYTSGTWNGDIVAYTVNEITGLQDQTATVWEAESKLPTWNSRKIYVNVNGEAKPFLYGNLSGAQQAHLSSDIVDFLRGDRSKEADKPGGTLRKRAGVLPAFINSQLVYVGPPTHGSLGKFPLADGSSAYPGWANEPAQKTRKPVIYIAGNNGMLHAFDASDDDAVSGKEIYAFLPNFSISEKLANYADKEYGSGETTAKPHQYILDGELTVADAYLDGKWKTILVATQGRGGSGIFALDVTDPDNIEFLWEKSATDDNALGNNLGKPIIAQVANKKWRVILGNGPNSTGDKAQLLMFDLAMGGITKVDTGVDGNNGLAAVNPWDSNKNGFYDTAYAGDLQGNVWRFKDLGTSPTAAKLLAGGDSRPITAMPLVVRNLKTGATWVYVGTGQYLNMGDLQSPFNTQTWYGLIDDGGPTIAPEDDLRMSQFESSGVGQRVLEAVTEWDIIGGASPKRGWYIDFPLDGERMMTPNSVRGGVLFGITFTPDASDPCSPNGSSSLWAVDPFSGGRIKQGIFDVDGDGIPDKTSDGFYLTVLDGLSAITTGALPSMFNSGNPDGEIVIVDPDDDDDGDDDDDKKKKKKKKHQVCRYLYDRTICHDAPTGQIGRQSWREIIGQ
ncbi:MAG: hypothetical protein LBE81_02665 [Azonexus sp.]|jgi:type IV pilus assembly protein PilY1|uniref:pilus assembly protein n=1 Tax=Azonexus sp. TaxID=1872668 RepID=UPI002828D532|nr:PilC/PilY family type IV pilus protein [Azonexus sp.]MDR0775523.1 hypothetical protein [Azonexus sp.]